MRRASSRHWRSLLTGVILALAMVTGSIGSAAAAPCLSLRTSVSAGTFLVIGSIAVGQSPIGIAYDPVNNLLYVTNSGSNNVSVIDASTNQVVGSIAVATTPWDAAVDTVHGCLYVSEAGSNNVSVVSLSSDRVVKSLPTGYDPLGVAFDEANGQVFVANSGNSNVTVINTTTQSVVGSFIMNAPVDLAVDATHGKLFVTAAETNFTGVAAVAVVDPSTDQISGWVPSRANAGIAFDSANGMVYAAGYLGLASGPYGLVDVFDGASDQVRASVNVGASPWGIAANPFTNYLYVANSLSDNVTVINGGSNTVAGWIPVGVMPYDVAFDSTSGNLYVTDKGSNNVTVIAGSIPTSSGSGSGSSSTGGSLPPWLLGVIVILAVLVATVVAYLAVRRRSRDLSGTRPLSPPPRH